MRYNTLSYVFVTNFGTILNSSPNGILYHAYPEEITPNIICDQNGKINGSLKLLDEPLHVRSLAGSSHYSISSNKGYLCSDIGGAIGWRQHCLALEQFRILPIQEVYKNIPYKNFIFPIKPQKFSISHIIHQTYDDNEIPEIFQKNVETLQTRNPTWKYMYWNSKNRHDFIYDFFGWEMLDAYLKINPRYGAARADFFRYLCIYQLGGVYLDLKSNCEFALDNIIRPDDQYLLSHWHNKKGESAEGCGLGPEVESVPGGEYQQWHIIAAAGHPFLMYVIKNVLARIHRYSESFYGNGKLGVLRVTGPYAYTMAIYPHINEFSHRFFDYEKSGLIYSTIGDHTKVFKRHYSQETSPLIL